MDFLTLTYDLIIDSAEFGGAEYVYRAQNPSNYVVFKRGGLIADEAYVLAFCTPYKQTQHELIPDRPAAKKALARFGDSPESWACLTPPVLTHDETVYIPRDVYGCDYGWYQGHAIKDGRRVALIGMYDILMPEGITLAVPLDQVYTKPNPDARAELTAAPLNKTHLRVLRFIERGCTVNPAGDFFRFGGATKYKNHYLKDLQNEGLITANCKITPQGRRYINIAD